MYVSTVTCESSSAALYSAYVITPSPFSSSAPEIVGAAVDSSEAATDSAVDAAQETSLDSDADDSAVLPEQPVIDITIDAARAAATKVLIDFFIINSPEKNCFQNRKRYCVCLLH